jgi:hypothetical protein
MKDLKIEEEIVVAGGVALNGNYTKNLTCAPGTCVTVNVCAAGGEPASCDAL